MLPIGVLIPTRNSARLLPRHLESLAGWLDLVQEVIVVDSFSEDGTLEMIKAGLRHPRLRILSHPPGLYQSWNHGIRQLKAKYCYISTVGDTISREGLQHLTEGAVRLDCDVIMSKPEFLSMEGRRAAAPFWPVDDMVQSLHIAAPQVLSRWEFVAFAAAHAGNGLLGSSASNLSRTAALASHPFPVDFGRAGDGIWALQNCCHFRWSVTPRVCSTFLLHEDLASQTEKICWATAPRSDLVMRETIENELQARRLDRATLRDVKITELMEEASRWLHYKVLFDRARKSQFRWFINPCAWHKRIKRNRHARALTKLKLMALSEIQRRGMNGSYRDEKSREVLPVMMAETGDPLKRCGFA